jgi:hypothetical protein
MSQSGPVSGDTDQRLALLIAATILIITLILIIILSLSCFLICRSQRTWR